MQAETFAALILALTLVWLFARNRAALLAYKTTLDGRPAMPSAKCAWAISVFSPWTGPAIPFVLFFALVLTLRARKYILNQKVAPHHSAARSKISLKASVENMAVVFLATALLVLAVWTLPMLE